MERRKILEDRTRTKMFQGEEIDPMLMSRIGMVWKWLIRGWIKDGMKTLPIKGKSTGRITETQVNIVVKL